MSAGNKTIVRLADALYSLRALVIGAALAATVLMVFSALRLRVDAGFEKLVPRHHEYMQTFLRYREEFGGANRVLVALMAKKGDIFTPAFFDALSAATDAVFFLPGVDKSRVSSLFTPDVRFTEVVVGGISGGNVVPAEFRPTPEALAQVRENVLKAGIVGRLVANDFTGALISAELIEADPATGRRLDYHTVARALAGTVRERFASDDIGVHIIGFAQLVGDIAAGAARIVSFFALALAVTVMLVHRYTRSRFVTTAVMGCALLAVIWQLGLLPVLGYGLDPMSLLVPFLILAIAVSHGMQMAGAFRSEIFLGADADLAARRAFRQLLVPGAVALVTDAAGFLTIRLIDVGIVRETATAATLGVGLVLIVNLFVLPLLLSYYRGAVAYRGRLQTLAREWSPVWQTLAAVMRRRPALAILGVAALLAIFGWRYGATVAIGDLHPGVPELRPDSRYNRDAALIASRFAIGVDVFTVFAEGPANGCVQHEVMSAVDDFAWMLANQPGVRSVLSLPAPAKLINAGWNEGHPKFQVLPRDRAALAQATKPVETASGLLNADCSVLPVLVFTEDHRAQTIARLVDAVKKHDAAHRDGPVRFRLAGGNVGVMAATNEAVRAAQFPILLGIYGAVIVLCLWFFRSLAATACIVLPLSLVSLLAYALMNTLEIGLKTNTLPIAALGVGVGVDYGIYLYSRLTRAREDGRPLADAWREALASTGRSVLYTGVTLAAGVATWIFSPLQFQADMGIMLTFLFLMNMLGALILLPALAAWLSPDRGARRREA